MVGMINPIAAQTVAASPEPKINKPGMPSARTQNKRAKIYVIMG
jgi:hypothetical protein